MTKNPAAENKNADEGFFSSQFDFIVMPKISQICNFMI